MDDAPAAAGIPAIAPGPSSLSVEEPAVVVGGLDGVGGGSGTGFADGGPEAAADFAFGDVEGAGDHGDRAAVAGGAEGVGLLVGEGGVGVLEGFGGEVGVDDAEAEVHSAY